jgi:hypothetical protein
MEGKKEHLVAYETQLETLATNMAFDGIEINIVTFRHLSLRFMPLRTRRSIKIPRFDHYTRDCALSMTDRTNSSC